ncbi:type I-C CRISPR-associated protein Cas5c [Allosphingosinicella indica]|uniref:CRISPR-associated protein, Cas5d family n=1 Tax=Allosphingosinicella indica TaxID=941907 RepID=A0A1X7FYA6_9SPHN|nr:type I-C CRISPR-associated protein Cas5c [Allosphingosinicella indica]SMF61011.1 CRISPR-associated protein, Cas5d family [Allosphingosinicella indica]
MPIKLLATGPRACFARPEFRTARVTYDVMTASAARGLLEAVHWKPGIHWRVSSIAVRRPIAVRGREMFERGSAAVWLEDVEYLIEAHLDIGEDEEPTAAAGKHIDMFHRRLRQQRFFRPPHLGAMEFPATLVDATGLDITPTVPPGLANRDLGWMLLDYRYEKGRKVPCFFHAALEQAVLTIPDMNGPGVLS